MKKLTSLLSLFLLLFTSINAQQKTMVNINRPLVTRQIALPDLQVSISSIEHDKGNYHINCTLKNTGAANVDLSNITMQGSIVSANGQFIQAGGGTKLVDQGSLEPGTEIQFKIGFTPTKKLIKNTAYTYQLKADETNSVAEHNESNNLATAPIIGYTDIMETLTSTLAGPLLSTTAFPDLTVEITSISAEEFHHKIYYKVKNIGTAALNVNVNGLRLLGSVWCTELRAECLSTDVKVLQPHAVLTPGQEINSYIVLEGSRQRSLLKSFQEYMYKIEIDNIKDIHELNENNNTTERKFKAM